MRKCLLAGICSRYDSHFHPFPLQTPTNVLISLNLFTMHCCQWSRWQRASRVHDPHTGRTEHLPCTTPGTEQDSRHVSQNVCKTSRYSHTACNFASSSPMLFCQAGLREYSPVTAGLQAMILPVMPQALQHVMQLGAGRHE